MYKLLVNCPDGTQDIKHIQITGGYNEESKVLWDERTDGSMPVITLGGMMRVGKTLVYDQPTKDAHDATINLQQTEQTRLEEINTEIKQDAVINELKAMTKAEFNTWWPANVTTVAQANNILKRLAFREINRD